MCGKLLQEIFFIRVCLRFFFFQAEDGIRDLTVTGVQTCALPILVVVAPRDLRGAGEARDLGGDCRGRVARLLFPTLLRRERAVSDDEVSRGPYVRSEERRVGKECRCRRAAYAVRYKEVIGKSENK